MTRTGPVLLAGGSGLLGTALGQAVASRGGRVVRLVRRPTNGDDEVRWDPAAGSLDRSALAARGPYGAAVNLAGAGIGDHRLNEGRQRLVRRSRLEATATLARALGGLDDPPPVLVNASAVGYYGDGGDVVLTEDAPVGTGFLAELCRDWEAAAAGAAARVVTVRTGVVLTSGGGALGRQLPLFRLGLGGRLGSGRQWLSWISLPDAVAGLLAAVDDEALRGPVNLTAPGPVTNAEFTRALGRVLHRPAVLAVPAPALRLALGSTLADELLLAGQRAVPQRLTAAGHRFTHPFLDGALAAVAARRA